MQNETSDDLLVMISFGDEEPESRRAFTEFYRRFNRYVWKLSYKAAVSLDQHNAYHIADYIAQNTFIDVHRNSSKFSRRTNDPDQDIKHWLSGFIRNKKLQCIDEIAKRNKFLDYMDDLEDLDRPVRETQVEEPEEDSTKNYQRTLIDRALLELRPIEKDVLLAFFEYQEEGKIQPDIKLRIAKKFGVKPNSLNQTKKRALAKVNAYVNKALKEAHIKKLTHAKQ